MTIMGFHTTGPAVRNHILSEMARELIAKNPTVYHLWFLLYQRVLPQLHFHLLLHHLHHRILYLTSDDTPKIQNPKEVEVRERSYGETRCTDQQKPKTKKNEGREEVQSDLLHDLPDWLQEFREILVDERNPSEPWRNRGLGYRDTSSSSHELPMKPTSRKTQIVISV